MIKILNEEITPADVGNDYAKRDNNIQRTLNRIKDIKRSLSEYTSLLNAGDDNDVKYVINVVDEITAIIDSY